MATLDQSQVAGSTLGYTAITTTFTTASTTSVQITGLTSTITVPAGGRKVKITIYDGIVYNSTTAVNTWLELWQGTVGSGTLLNSSSINSSFSASLTGPIVVMAIVTLAAGSYTFNAGAKVSVGTGNYNATSTQPAFILVELI
jgi:hypothetical protein